MPRPLTGGVSSAIAVYQCRRGPVVVKQALPRLRVAARWEAPVERSGAEADWLRVAAELVPGSVPAVYASDRAAGLIAMAYLDPADHPVWKVELLAGRIDPAFGAAVGGLLGRLHAGAAARPELAGAFANEAMFNRLRLDPYLRATAAAWPELAGAIAAVLATTVDTRLTLVHGDVSPKNVLVGPGGPVLLDAECATWGDPAFDLAFCLNHVLLKAVHAPSAAARFLQLYRATAAAYCAEVSWEPVAALRRRTAALLPALMLARVDGKSPVEYLDPAARHRVRWLAGQLLREPGQGLDHIADRVGAGT